VLRLSNSSTCSFPSKSSNSCLRLIPRLPFPPIFPSPLPKQDLKWSTPDVVHRLYQCTFTFRPSLFHGRWVNFISLILNSIICRSLIPNFISYSQQHYLEISHTKFHQNPTTNTASTNRKSCKPKYQMALTAQIFTKVNIIPQQHNTGIISVWQLLLQMETQWSGQEFQFVCGCRKTSN
jgi:hypothetical protein